MYHIYSYIMPKFMDYVMTKPYIHIKFSIYFKCISTLNYIYTRGLLRRFVQ